LDGLHVVFRADLDPTVAGIAQYAFCIKFADIRVFGEQ
jgi:hypothetical protein